MQTSKVQRRCRIIRYYSRSRHPPCSISLPGGPKSGIIVLSGFGKVGYVGSPVPRVPQLTVPPILHLAQTSVCSDRTSASSTSMPRYRSVLSSFV